MIGQKVKPGIRLHVVVQRAQARLGELSEEPSRGGARVRRHGLTGTVEHQALGAKAGRTPVQFLDRLPGQAEALPQCFGFFARAQVAAVVRVLLRREALRVDLAEEVEQRLQQLRVPGTVEALAVVLDGELPVAVFDDVDLVRNLGVGERVGREIRRHALRHVLEVSRRLIGHTHEDEAREAFHVQRLERRLPLRHLPGRAAVDARGRRGHRSSGDRGTCSVAPGDAAVLLQDARTAVPAGVVEGADRAVVAPQEKDRVRADLVGAVVAAFGQLGLRGQEQPVAREDGVKLRLIKRLVGEERPRQRASGLACREQCRDVFAHVHR